MTEQRDSHGGRAHPLPNSVLLTAIPGPQPQTVLTPALSPLRVTADGWLEGSFVKHNPTGIPSGTGWHYGHPIGVLNHFTVGCGDPHDTLVSRGVSAHGCTLQDGTLMQYIPFTHLSFHAYDQAYYTVGWENAVYPGTCDFDTYMLGRLAQVNAAVIAWTKETYGFDIPAERSPGWHYQPGIKSHADGLEPGSPWDPKRHWDCPWKATGDEVAQWMGTGERAALDRSPWTAEQFIDAVKAGGEDDVPLTPAQEKTLADAEAFLAELRGKIGAIGDPAKPATVTGAADRVARTVTICESSGGPVPKHDHPFPSGRTGKN